MKHYTITVNGTPYDVVVAEAGSAPAPAATPVATAPVAVAAVAAPVAAPAAGGAQGSIVVEAPMPGTLLDIKVSVGQQVKTGDILVVLEAMKMENEIVAAQEATVTSINCAKGDMVNSGDILVTLS